MRKKSSKLKLFFGTILKVSSKLFLCMAVVVGFIKGAEFAFDFGHKIFYNDPVEKAPGEDITVNIPKGLDTEDIALSLKKNGIIKDEIAFIIQSNFFALKPKPGEYKLNTSMKIRKILDILSGETKDK